MTSFQIQQSNGVNAASSTYQYYADGGLRFSHSVDDRFDRAFTYDHAARVSEAYSGSEARDFINGTNSGGTYTTLDHPLAAGVLGTVATGINNAGQVVGYYVDNTGYRGFLYNGGRLYLDVMQNSKGHHAVPPYIVRAIPAATVSTPLEWKELTARLIPARFDLQSAQKRFKGKKDLMAPLIS